MKLREAKNIHCIGAGGIGLSALAKLLAARGQRVTASDMAESSVSRELADSGVAVTYGQSGELPAGTEIVVYTDAAPYDNPEREEARRLGLPEMSYAEALGAVSRDKRTVAVSGSNGKSTTTAMIGLILEAAGFDPTVVVGSKVPGFPLGNLRIGEGEWLVVEADDYRAHMLHLRPEAIVLTNIEEEHLDYFSDLNHIIRTFQAFVDSLPEDGLLMLNADDPVSFDDLSRPDGAVTYGIAEPADYNAAALRVGAGEQSFDLTANGGADSLGRFALNIPGRFNVSNALAAASCALSLGVPAETVRETLAGFRGIWRRFERVGEWDGCEVISDYGHHPTAAAVTIAAARDFYPGRRIVVVFQPHQRHRTRALLHDFAAAFDGAGLLILSDIYDVAGRENAADGEVTSALLAQAVASRPTSPRCLLGGDLRRTEDILRANAEPGDVIVVMGAGSIDSLARDLVRTS